MLDEKILERLNYVASNFGEQALAEEVGVSHSCMLQWLRGSDTPNLDHLIAVAQYSNTSLDWLLRGMGGVWAPEAEPAPSAGPKPRGRPRTKVE